MKVIDNELHTENMVIAFHRTYRLPEDGKTYPLPRSVGKFPLKRIEDYKDKVPASWAERGGVFMPLHQREAMWIAFGKRTHAPCAVKVGMGKVNAITGEPWKDGLDGETQDYLVAPPQPWIDGIKAGDGTVKQFVAMPLGMGYTVEGQVTGEETHGGLQLAIYPGKRSHFPKPKKNRTRGVTRSASGSNMNMGWSPQGIEEDCYIPVVDPGSVAKGTMKHSSVLLYDQESAPSGGNEALYSANMNAPLDMGPERGITCSTGSMKNLIAPTTIRRRSKKRRVAAEATKAAAMGLGAGGTMRQQIYPDPHGVEVWDQGCKQRVFVHLVNAEMYEQITGEAAPPSPITKEDYFRQGLPWFDVFDKDLGDVDVSTTLGGVKTIGQKDAEHGFEGQQDDSSAPIESVVNCGKPKAVKNELDGSW